jgi:hypothetical protein
MNELESIRPELDRIQQRSLIVGAVGVILCGVGAFTRPEQFHQSYLFAYLFWFGITAGSFGLLMLHHLVGGRWGLAIRRLLEAGTRTMPLMVLLFVPIALGIHHLYEWSHADVVARDELLRHKSAYLNVPFFLGRAAVYFAIWLILGFFFNKWSEEQDRTGDPRATRRLGELSGPGLVLFSAVVTFSSIDWAMSLEPHWFSAIYGMIFMVGQTLTALTFMLVIVSRLSDRKPLSDVLTQGHFHDLGNLLLAFVMLWAYIAISQFLIIWSGNLPEEIPWYLTRMNGGWKAIAMGLVVVHFFMPFLLLLLRATKRNVRLLAALAMVLVVIRLIDLYWVVMPAFPGKKTFSVHWMDLAALMGIGGLWMTVFAWRLKGRALLPLHDPLLEESLHHA